MKYVLQHSAPCSSERIRPAQGAQFQVDGNPLANERPACHETCRRCLKIARTLAEADNIEGAIMLHNCVVCRKFNFVYRQQLGMGAGRGEEWYSSASSGSREGMERNVARLFQERGPIFGEIDLTQASVLAGVDPALTDAFVNFFCGS